MTATLSRAAATPQVETSTRDEARWAAVLARDSAFDGHFFHSVATTGIYCRPSCAARRPKRAHVRFHHTAAEAERAGFRPCKRCKPNAPSLIEQHAAKVGAACRLIEEAERPLRLGELAAAAGLSPHHFHRVFKSMLGITPKDYVAAHRRERVREEAWPERHHHSCDLRRGLQFEQPVLCDVFGGSWHDTKRVS